jgi:SNF2 family DNA or RNA helicase
VPLSLESCQLLQQKFGRQLKIGTELKRWAIGVQQSRAYMKKLASSADAELERLHHEAPLLAAAMEKRTYQRVGARFIADLPASLIADDPGLGKTLIAMGGILESGVEGPYLIVAPKTASDSVWRREIMRWLPADHRPVTMPHVRAQRERRLNSTRYGPKTWVIVHPEMVQVQRWLECQEWVPDPNDDEAEIQCLRWTADQGRGQDIDLDCGHQKQRNTKKIDDHAYPKLFSIAWGAIVVDESHESLIRRTGKTTQRRRGLDLLKLRGGGLKIAMSGTPTDSKAEQLWGTLNWLDPVQYSAFNRWAELYWRKTGYTGHQIGEFIKEREQMLWDSLSAISLRRTKEEVAPDLPPKVYVGSPLVPQDEDGPVGIWLEMDGKQAKAYDQFAATASVQLKSGNLSAIIALEELTRLKQMACSYGDIERRKVWATDEDTGQRVRVEKDFYVPTLPSNKFDWIAESLEEWGFPRNPITKVVIVSFYTGILDLYRNALEKHFKTRPGKPMCAAITGKTPSQHRRQIIDRFNRSGTETVMLLNVKAGGTAITLDTADRMIFVSETRIPDQQKQAEDRIHRISNPRTCMYYYLRTLGTVDVGTAIVNAEMIHDTHRLLDQRRGVDYMRHVMELSS